MYNLMQNLNRMIVGSLIFSTSAAFSMSFHPGTQEREARPPEKTTFVAMVNPSAPQSSKTCESQNIWVQIPTWLAGTWCTVDDLALHEPVTLPLSMVPNINLPVMSITVQGTQIDKLGRIWQYMGTPLIHKVQYTDWLEEQVVDKIELPKAAKDQFVLTDYVEITDRDKDTGSILEKFHEKATITYQLLRAGEVKVTTEFTDTSTSGVFLGCRRSQEYQLRMAPFRPVDADSKTDFREKFREFMSQNHPGGL
jgi:hypothetical protein